MKTKLNKYFSKSLWLIFSALVVALTGCDSSSDNKTGSSTSADSSIPSHVTIYATTRVGLPIPKGHTQDLVGVATYSDGHQEDISNEMLLHVDDSAIASASGYTITGISQGDVTVWATFMGVSSENIILTVSDAELASLSIQVVEENELLGEDEGNIPAWNDIIAGTSKQLVATALYEDGTSADVTNQVTWRSSPGSEELVTLSSGGLLTTSSDAIAEFTTENVTIVAEIDNVGSNPLSLYIRHASLSEIKLVSKAVETRTESEFELAAGSSFEYRAIGIYEDGSRVNLTKSVSAHTVEAGNNDGYLLNLSENGYITAKNTEGSNKVTVSYFGVVSNALQFTITSPELTSIEVAPNSVSVSQPVEIIKNLEQQFIAIGVYSDGSRADITRGVNWNEEVHSGVISLSTTGFVRALVEGHSQIRVTPGEDIKSSADLEPVTISIRVIAPTLESIKITTEDDLTTLNELTIPVNSNYQLRALGIYSDGTTADISDIVNWETNKHADENIINAYQGLISTTGNTGTETVTARLRWFIPAISSNTLTVEVTN